MKSEICPARFTKTQDGWVTDASLPLECRSCLQLALETRTAVVNEADTMAEAMVAMWGLYPEFDPEAAHKWESTLMKAPDGTSTREVEIAYGFDLDTHSYVVGTETATKSIFFDCES